MKLPIKLCKNCELIFSSLKSAQLGSVKVRSKPITVPEQQFNTAKHFIFV